MHFTEAIIIACVPLVGVAIKECFGLLRDHLKHRAEAKKPQGQKPAPSETRVQVVVFAVRDESEKLLLPENSPSPKKTSKKRGAKSERKGARGSALNSQGN